jgi:hypothetical protein
MEGMAILHDEEGKVVACFTISEISGIVAEDNLVEK